MLTTREMLDETLLETIREALGKEWEVTLESHDDKGRHFTVIRRDNKPIDLRKLAREHWRTLPVLRKEDIRKLDHAALCQLESFANEGHDPQDIFVAAVHFLLDFIDSLGFRATVSMLLKLSEEVDE